jgi:hypothetical protein
VSVLAKYLIFSAGYMNPGKFCLMEQKLQILIQFIYETIPMVEIYQDASPGE